MKNRVLVLLVVLGITTSWANGPESYVFKTAEDDIVLEVQRAKTEVQLHLLIKNSSEFESISIERSPENTNSFGRCKYIALAEEKLSTTGYLMKTDKYPYSACKDVYYRINTISKTGVSRTYAPVLLESVNSTATSSN